jgi:hypothetical protein
VIFIDLAPERRDHLTTEDRRQELVRRKCQQRDGFFCKSFVCSREWSKTDVKELKAHSKAKTPVAKVSKVTKRKIGVPRQKHYISGLDWRIGDNRFCCAAELRRQSPPRSKFIDVSGGQFSWSMELF